MVGHIKIDRKILNWEWYSDYKMVHLFLHLLIKANYKENKWQGRTIKRGQLITGINKLSGNTGLSVSQTRTCLNKLQTTGEITIEVTNKYSIITICKYDTYQSEKDPNRKQDSKQLSTQDDNQDSKQDDYTLRKQEDKNIKPIEPSGIVFEMTKIFKKYNPAIQIEPEIHFAPCLQMAYRIAKMKGWEEKDVLNGKITEALKSWEKIVEFVKSDEWLSTRSLIDLNSNKEWDRLIMKMTNSKSTPSKKENNIGSPIKKESDIDWKKYK